MKNWQRYTLEWGVLAILVIFITGMFRIGSHCDPEAYCPFGAIANTLKDWLWIITILGVVYVASSIAGQIPVWILITLLCLAGYLFEILNPKASMQVLNVKRNSGKCTDCKLCEKSVLFISILQISAATLRVLIVCYQ